MKQKVSIAISLVNDPEIIIYDEPTNGLDIIATDVVIRYIKRMKEQGKTIIISTHIFEVVEELCDDVAILIEGQIKYNNTMKDVQTKYKNLRSLFFELYEDIV
jgi:sodium transport system ATP-binding protein